MLSYQSLEHIRPSRGVPVYNILVAAVGFISPTEELNMPRRKQTTAQELDELSTPLRRGPSTTPASPSLNMETLVDALRTLQPQPARPHLKPPQFSGATDIELFLDQFEDVARINRWSSDEYLLHLKLSLTDKAAECSRGSTTPEIQDSLRNRFGISQRQAREGLRNLRKTNKQSVHELSSEIKRLIKLAYPNLDEETKEEMALEAFLQALDNRAIKRHLLATPAFTLNEAVQKADDYLQVGEQIPARVTAVQDTTPTIQSIGVQQLQEMMTGFQSLLKQQTELLTQMSTRSTTKPPIKCYECGGPHLKRNCPRLQEQHQQTSTTPHQFVPSFQPPHPNQHLGHQQPAQGNANGPTTHRA